MRLKCALLTVVVAFSVACAAFAQSDWQNDERVTKRIALPQKTMSLEDLCAELSKQTGVEFYVDRRHKDSRVALYVGASSLRRVMLLVESVTGMQWRTVGDMFFLSRDRDGVAVVRWKDRYRSAKEAHLAGVTEKEAREWLSSAMPFPPRVDPEWQLTPIQMEQIAYNRSLLVFTMTPPQLRWLNMVLPNHGFQSDGLQPPVERLLWESPEIPVEMTSAMIIHSQDGEYLVEMPLTKREEKVSENEQAKPETLDSATAAPQAKKTKSSSSKSDLTGLWITGGDTKDLPALLRKAKAKGFGSIFVPVLQNGHTIYPSNKLPRDERTKTSDMLLALIKAADVAGMKLHAVIDATQWGDKDHPVPRAANYTIAFDRNLLGRTYAEQEKWQHEEGERLKIEDARLASDDTEHIVRLCPASSLVSRLLRDVAQEIAQYPVAGLCVHGVDYARSTPFVLNGEDLSPPFGYTLEVRREMIRLHQIDPIDMDASSIRTPEDSEAWAIWDMFRRGRLTGLITEVCSTFKAKRPDAMCSATLDLTSDGPSPAHWAAVKELNALIPLVSAQKSSEAQTTSIPRETTDAIAGLHRAVLKDASVVPAVVGLSSGSASEDAGTVKAFVKFAGETGLTGYILQGDTDTLSAALDALDG